MPSRKQHDNPVAMVIISAVDESRKQVLELSIPVDDYYGESHPVIDDDVFRSDRAIRYVRGLIFDYDGNLDQEFNNEYGLDGSYIRSKVVHADGTVVED